MSVSSYIHISKRRFVDEICELVKNSGIVNRLLIFGSAVTGECTQESDLDICLDTDCEDNNTQLLALYQQIGRVCDYDCDILKYSRMGAQLKEEVDRKGVVVYDVAKDGCRY